MTSYYPVYHSQGYGDDEPPRSDYSTWIVGGVMTLAALVAAYAIYEYMAGGPSRSKSVGYGRLPSGMIPPAGAGTSSSLKFF